MHTVNMSNAIISPTDKMSKPHTSGTNGQFNDEYDMNAFEKMRKKHYIPRKINYDEWEDHRPNIANLPSSCDDEMFDDYIVTTVDVGMVKNAAANALKILQSKTIDVDIDVTEENCLRVSLFYREAMVILYWLHIFHHVSISIFFSLLRSSFFSQTSFST